MNINGYYIRDRSHYCWGLCANSLVILKIKSSNAYVCGCVIGRSEWKKQSRCWMGKLYNRSRFSIYLRNYFVKSNETQIDYFREAAQHALTFYQL
ncbi:unnamed protein product [Phytomonas sp. EM1]|nr:unnamed protein product [Phytomonas sp. EM1]|eukprot:CCW60589.1 unnamed protein product [Phytomonas sp. isolate EM1]